MLNSGTTLSRAFRSLARSPGYFAGATLTSALGIGALTAVFSLFSQAILEPLPYPNAPRLVVVQETRNERTISVAWLNLEDLRTRSRSLDGLAAFFSASLNLTSDGDAMRVFGHVVTSNLFDVLGVRPLLGRGFLREEDEPGGRNVAVLGHGLWTTRYGSDSGIVGRTIVLSGQQYEVVGVMPRGFRFADGIVYGPADLWLPMSRLAADAREDRGEHPGLVGIGRLRPGFAIEAARQDLRGIAASLEQEYPNSNAGQSVRVDDATTVILGGVRNGLWLLLGAVCLLVLIAGANVAGLSLARTMTRGRELAIRLALGARQRRLAGQLVAENVVVGVTGGALGLMMGWAALQALGANTSGLPRLEQVKLDWRVFVFIAVASLVVSVLSAMAPLLWARRIEADRWLRSRNGDDAGGARTRRVFVTVEVALSVVLLAVSALLLRSFGALRDNNGGIEPDAVLAFSVNLPADPYADTARATGFFQRLESQLEQMPGIEAVGAISVLPFSGAGAQSGISRFGETGHQAERSTDVMVVTPEYFRAMGIDLVRGRLFTPQDRAGATPVAIVDERFAQTFWPGEDPIGKQVQGWGFQSLDVVGVVRHVTSYGVAATSREEMYVPHLLRPSRQMTVLVRGKGDPSSWVAPVRRVVRDLDPGVPIYRVRPMRDIVDDTLAGPRLSAFVSTAFAVVALLLSAAGLYALIAFHVAQRTREIGVRLALGAQRASVVASVIRQALGIVMAGCGLGALVTVGAIRLIRNQLFGVDAGDPLVFAGVALLLLVVAIAASLIPARRAANVAPLVAMRDD